MRVVGEMSWEDVCGNVSEGIEGLVATSLVPTVLFLLC